MRTFVVIVFGLQLSSCCTGLKEAIRSYGMSAESSADTTTELVKRCKAAATDSDPVAKETDLAACAQALRSLDAQKAAAGQLKTVN